MSKMWHIFKDGRDESPSEEDVCKNATEKRKKQIVAKRHEQMKKDLAFKV